MNKQIYPIGEQFLTEILNSGQVYVDKTQFIPVLLRNKCYFLSRPRRFGKSLFLSTLEQFFLGNRQLFDGLAISNYDWSWETYPIIRMSFGTGSFTEEGGLEERMLEIIEDVEDSYHVEVKGNSPRARLRNLILQLYKQTGKGVVILIDEYEKPLLDSYGEEIFDNNHKKLSAFYSVFKDNLDKIKFLFITGVSRFGQLNIFSGLNNLQDISLEPQFQAICGITEEEIRSFLMPGVEHFAEENDCSVEEAIGRLKEYYDGYHFSQNLLDIYNPWSLINCLNSGRLKSEWFRSGSPSYLLKILKKKNYDIQGLLGSMVSENKLTGSGIDIMDPTSLLYQTGYLTIKDYDRENSLYKLGMPNFEVRTALLECIIPFYLGKEETLERSDVIKLFGYLEKGEADKMMEWLSAYFSKISFDNKLRFERDFQMIVLGIFLLIKDFKDVHCEYAMSSGRTDLVVEASNYVYVFEFKIGEDPAKALEQINSRVYDLPWRADGRKVFKIGAAFSTNNNGILSYRIEE